jgi:Icc-related predicted phosphoesterase
MMKTLKICAISDTHEQHDTLGALPDADILVHAGDWTFKGTMGAMENFLRWLSNQPHSHKIFVSGNHELGLDSGPMRQQKLDLIKSFTNKNPTLHYLEHEPITISGVRFFGSPYQPWFHSWAWNVQRGEDIAYKWSQIPNDTQCLIVHGPPYMILDRAPRGIGQYENVGCEDLAKRVKELSDLKAVIFGHIHRDNNESPEMHNGVIFANASICNNNKCEPTNQPVLIDIEV